MTTPRTIPSPDDAPCGSLLRFMDAGEGPDLVVRLVDGTGWYVGYGTSIADEEDGMGWEWGKPYGPTGEVVVLAEGLTADECFAISGMDADAALAWCSARATDLAKGETTTENERGCGPKCQGYCQDAGNGQWAVYRCRGGAL